MLCTEEHLISILLQKGEQNKHELVPSMACLMVFSNLVNISILTNK